MKAFILARVSTEEQKEAGNSLPAQTERLNRYCEKKNLTIEQTFSFDESAYKQDRQEFTKILEQIKISKETVALVCDKIDRLIRNFSHDLVILEELRVKGRIELHFPSDNIILHRESPATDLFRFGMGVNLAKYFSDSISDNVKRAFEEKLRNGQILGPAPYGYRNIVKEDGTKWVEPKPFEFKVVQVIYGLYATGVYSMDVIRMKLKTDHNITLSKGKVDQILKSKFYCGYLIVKGNEYPHYYEKAVDEELYEKVQQVKSGKSRPYQPTSRYGGKPITYRGLIKCAYCGCSITADIKKGKYTYYYCTDYNKKHKQNGVPVQYFSEKDLTVQFAKMFESMKIPEDKLNEIKETLNASHEGKKKLYDAKFSKLSTDHAKYEKMIENLYDDKASGSITIDFYTKKLLQYQTAQKAITKELEKLQIADKNYYMTANTILSLAAKASELFKVSKPDQKREILSLVLSNCTINGENLCYDLKKPFDTILECVSCNGWLRGLDSNQGP